MTEGREKVSGNHAGGVLKLEYDAYQLDRQQSKEFFGNLFQRK
jgi:hypothetical protein